MILTFKRCPYKNPVEIIEALGLTWSSEYTSMSVGTNEFGQVEIDCPDSLAEDIRDLIEPFKGRADYALSDFKNLTWPQIRNRVRSISSMAEALEYIEKLSFVVFAVVEHTQINRR